MMDNECLSLTWNNHGATYRNTLNHLRQENTLTDVTLACDGQKFSAHKLVLVTCSDYFHKILGDLPCQHPIVYLRGITAKEMQALIDFMYTGRTDIPQKEVPLLLSTAEALQIKGLGVYDSKDGSNNTKSSEFLESVKHDSQKQPQDSSLQSNFKDVDVANVTDDKSIPSSINTHSQILENIYNHHYALMSSPKRRKVEDRISTKSPEYTLNNSHASGYDRIPSIDSHSQSTEKNLLHHSDVTDLFPLKESNLLKTSLSSPSIYSNVMHHSSPQSLHLDVHKRSASSQEPLHDPRPETKTASPRALNYTLAGLGGKEDYGIGSLANILEESNTGLGDTPENLMKGDVKEEALDFTNTALSENIAAENIPLSASSIEEEARVYLDVFTRSANLNNVPLEDNQDAGSNDGRPFSCPICQKSFAKAAILKRHHLAHFRPYVCHLCKRSFTRREVLAEHILEHNGADLRMPCPVCNMTIKRKRNLQAHIKVKHPDYYKQKIASNESVC